MGQTEQIPIKVACFGQPASYTDGAMKMFFEGKLIDVTYESQFEDIVQAVSRREVRYGVLPIENSSTGGITDVYDLIHRYDCYIIGEKYVKIEHCLLGVPGATIDDINEVYSHPQGLTQCRGYFKHHRDWAQHPYYSTSESAKFVAETGDKHIAAVANRMAAETYHLDVLSEHINDNTTNYTRFFVISAEMEENPKADKITLVLTVQHKPGALYHILGYFFYNAMNMTHLESRPIKGRPFEYFFHVDVMGNLQDDVTDKVIHNLSEHCNYFKILGNYQSDKGGNPR